jgi:acyl carrier protein
VVGGKDKIMAKSLSIEEKVKEIIAEIMAIDTNVINADSTMVGLNADSLDVIQLIMEMEDVFDIDLPDAEFEPLKTVGDIVGYVDKKIKEKE